MSYLNLDLNYFDHIKTVRLIGLLGKGSEVLPIRLWCYCGKHKPEDGKLDGYSDQEIESIVGWWGNSGAMIGAFLKIGFLEEIENGYKVHEWEQHEGHLAMLKERAIKAAQARWNKDIKTGNAKSKKKKCLSNASSIAQASVKQCPNLTNHTMIKEEEKEPDKPVYSSEFEKFWFGTNGKGNKKAAFKAFENRLKTHSIEEINQAWSQCKIDKATSEKNFWPDISTLLNSDFEGYIDRYKISLMPKKYYQNIGC